MAKCAAANRMLYGVRRGMRSEGGGEVVNTTSYLTSGTDGHLRFVRWDRVVPSTSVSGGTDETLLVGPLVKNDLHP